MGGSWWPRAGRGFPSGRERPRLVGERDAWTSCRSGTWPCPPEAPGGRPGPAASPWAIPHTAPPPRSRRIARSSPASSRWTPGASHRAGRRRKWRGCSVPPCTHRRLNPAWYSRAPRESGLPRGGTHRAAASRGALQHGVLRRPARRSRGSSAAFDPLRGGHAARLRAVRALPADASIENYADSRGPARGGATAATWWWATAWAATWPSRWRPPGTSAGRWCCCRRASHAGTRRWPSACSTVWAGCWDTCPSRRCSGSCGPAMKGELPAARRGGPGGGAAEQRPARGPAADASLPRVPGSPRVAGAPAVRFRGQLVGDVRRARRRRRCSEEERRGPGGVPFT